MHRTPYSSGLNRQRPMAEAPAHWTALEAALATLASLRCLRTFRGTTQGTGTRSRVGRAGWDARAVRVVFAAVLPRSRRSYPRASGQFATPNTYVT